MLPDTLDQDLFLRAKTRLLRMHYESGVGHIGGNLSALDILLCLYHKILQKDDAFILSKGHAAGALYIALWSVGVLSEADLVQFHREDTLLSGHPPVSGIPEVLFGTGSLGHGLSLAAGLALGKKLKGQPGRVFCMLSDGEWNEGSNWEALIFANQQNLDNLTIVVDLNGLQGFGTTREVADLGVLGEKLRTFGFNTEEINGHDPPAIIRALETQAAQPNAIVANTTKGNGISFMENRLEWHYLPLNEALYQQALQELTRL